MTCSGLRWFPDAFMEMVLVNVLVLQRGGIIIQVMIFIDSSSYISITIRATTTDNIILSLFAELMMSPKFQNFSPQIRSADFARKFETSSPKSARG